MGTGCSTYRSLHVHVPTPSRDRNLEVAKSKGISEEKRSERRLKFEIESNELSFIEIASPRNGVVIKWRKGEVIGEGTFATVFQCIDLVSGRLMAVKSFKFSEDLIRLEKEFLNVKREVRLLRNLNHPNIVKYYQTDLSIQENSIDVLLEYVPGGSLKSILQRYKSLEIEIIRCYAKQLLSGLAYLHENQIVHRDLKPANVLISSEGVVKLTDLGSSRKFTELDNELSKSLKGSPYWMAPEIVTRAGHSFSADIWSFGCVLIEMVNGFPPWYNYSKDTRAVLNMIAKEGALPDFPDTTTELKNIITLCLNRSPNARPTAKDLRSHLFFKQSVLQ